MNLATILAPPMPPPRYREQPTPRRQAALDRSREIRAALRRQTPVQQPIDHAEVMRLHAEGLGHRQIADQLGHDRHAIAKLTRLYADGRTIRQRTPLPFDLNAAVADYLAGLRGKPLYAKYGVTRGIMRVPLRRLGLML